MTFYLPLIDPEPLRGAPALEQLLRAQVDGGRGDHVVPGLQEGVQDQGDGRHARAGQEGPVRAFQGRQDGLHLAEVGIAPAGVELDRLGLGGERRAFPVLLELEDGGLEDGRGHPPGRIEPPPGVDGRRGRSPD